MPARDEAPRTFEVTSPDFRHGEPIPGRCTCDGEDRSPRLSWTGVPVETRSFALIGDDPDAPRTWQHWLLYNLAPAAGGLPAGVRAAAVPGSIGMNGWSQPGYGGPCPPEGKPHRYFFRLHALDISLNLPPGVNRADLDAAIAGHVLAVGTLMGTYERPRS